MSLGSDVIVIKNAELVEDSRDNTSYRDWDNAVSVTVTGCFVQPFLMSEKLQFEFTADREYSTTGFQVFTPYEVELNQDSRITFDGDEYEVQGQPGFWRDFSGTGHHCEFIMKRRLG